MKTFKEFIEEARREEDGTYIAVKVDNKSATKLQDFVLNLGVELQEPIDKSEYHTTITYSRKTINDANTIDFKLPLNAKPTGWEVFDSKFGKCLVLRVDDTSLKDYHQRTMDMGGTYDFEGDVPKEVPTFNITYDRKEVNVLEA